jgi:hypothetical protein
MEQKNKHAVALGKLGGSSVSEAKQRSARKNGALGGRPRGSARNSKCSCGSGLKRKDCCDKAKWLQGYQSNAVRTDQEINLERLAMKGRK